MNPNDSKPTLMNRVAAFVVRPNPYCSFKNDDKRLAALKSRDMRLIVIALGTPFAYLVYGIIKHWLGIN